MGYPGSVNFIFFFSFSMFLLLFLGVFYSFIYLVLFYLIFGLIGFGSFYLFFSFDFLGWFLVEMSLYIFFLVFFGRIHFVKVDSFFMIYSSLFLFLFLFLFLAFGVERWFMLYFFFECCILPTFFVILGWGYGDGRLQASFYFFFYTLFFSLPFFILLFFWFSLFGSFNVFLFYYFRFGGFLYAFWGLSLFIFLVKLPIFFFHLWLPRAHVEASLSGSIVLAAILLKLGSYGLYRLCLSFWGFMSFYLPFLFSWGSWGAFLSAISCFRQVDLKRLVAFISVFHINFMLAGFAGGLSFSSVGAILYIIAHGICSSCLFGLVNFFYERGYSRRVIIVRGGLEFFSSFTLFLFLSCCLNISFPPSLNFFSEVLIIWGVIFFSSFGLLFSFFVVLIGCITTIHFFVLFFHGYGREIVFGFPIDVSARLFFSIHVVLPYLVFLFFV